MPSKGRKTCNQRERKCHQREGNRWGRGGGGEKRKKSEFSFRVLFSSYLESSSGRSRLSRNAGSGGRAGPMEGKKHLFRWFLLGAGKSLLLLHTVSQTLTVFSSSVDVCIIGIYHQFFLCFDLMRKMNKNTK
jgi:hypothetical protein